MRAGWRAGVLAALAFIAPTVASAEEMVVAAARGIDLKPGQKVDSSQPLKLGEGQHVTLISLSGVTLKLDGPYDKPPAQASGGGVVSAALAALVTQQGARTIEAGVTRSAASVSILPDPWVLDISRSGTVCLREGQPAIFWRPSSASAATFSVVPADRTWKAEATWPKGSNRLLASGVLAVQADTVFFVSLDEGDEAAITVNGVPDDLPTKAMQAAWLAQQGCEAQAEALLRDRP